MQDLQRKADIDPALLVALGEALGPIHFLADIGRHRRIERGLRVRQFVFGGVGAAFGEERSAVELEQLFLGQPAHHVGDIALVDAIAEATLEAVRVEQRHEKLEILFLAVVRRRRHEEEMPAARAEKLPELIALRVFDLAAEEARRHAVGFVADDEIPFAGCAEHRLQIVVAAQHVEPGDQQARSPNGLPVRAAST